MQALTRRITLLVGFSLLVALVVVNTWVIRSRVNRQVATHHWVVHTEQVLNQMALTESLLKDAETGQRGYLFTGGLSYLDPYNAARLQVELELGKLAALTADNAEQQKRVQQIRELTQAKLDELASTITLYQSGRVEDSRQLVLTNVGKQTMDHIRALFDEMRSEEARLDAQRSAEYEHSVRVTDWCILLTSVIAVLGLAGLAYSIVRDIRGREQHAADLLDRESWFRITLSSIGDGVIATDGNGKVTFMNPVAEKLTGRWLGEAKGNPIEKAFPIFNEITNAPVENPVAKVMQLGSIVGLANHTVLRHKDGTVIPIEDSAAPIRDARGELIGVVLVFRDATHERQTQEVLRRTEKLAATARLASTMAHEINNPLEAIGNLIFLASQSEDLPQEAAVYLSGAEDELQRVFHSTRQTLGFYRESRLREQTDVVALVQSVLKIFDNKLRAKEIEVSTDLAPVPTISTFSGEIRQVVANLLSNAADAVPANGRIGIRVRSSEDGGGVEISVQDNGPGIAAEHLPRIFEAFFTTKNDVGTGLGLWVAKEVAERHGGCVRVSTNTDGGHGTTFTVFLPKLPQAQSANAV